MRNWIEAVERLFERRLRPEPVMPLATFIAKNGGLELDGDTRAADFHKLYVPGAGPLARKSGKSIDGYWRNALADNGYIPFDDERGSISRDVRGELFDMLHAEQRKRMFGNGVDIVGPDDTDEESKDFQTLEDEVAANLREAGIERPDPGTLTRAAMLIWNGHQEDPIDAFEEASMTDPIMFDHEPQDTASIPF